MSFSQGRFADLLDRTPFAGELGLDGTSRVPAMRQRKTLRTALEVLAEKPRIVSLHSYAATTTVLGELEAIPVRGTILHWWLGEPAQTRRAIDLGCFFSINEAMVRRPKLLAELPLERVLTETDHPFGNRHSPGERRPGNVAAVELALAQRYGLSPAELRQRVWSNLGSLVALASCSALVPRKVRAHLAALR
jgi:TatD DNase family protein